MVDNTLSRIKKFIDSKGISIRMFEQSVGMSNGSFASQLKNNKTIGVDKIENILQTYTEVNPVWLLTGQGKMLIQPQSITPQNDEECMYLRMLEMKNAEIKDKDVEIKILNREIGSLQSDVNRLETDLKSNIEKSQEEKEQMKNTIEDLQEQIEAYRDATTKYDGKTVDGKLPKYKNVVNN